MLVDLECNSLGQYCSQRNSWCQFVCLRKRQGDVIIGQRQIWKNNCTHATTDNRRLSILKFFLKTDKADQSRSGDYDVPRVWLPDYNCFKRHRSPMVPMHAIANNMMACVMDFHHQTLSKWKKFNAIVCFASEIISHTTSFKLEWCKVTSLPKASWIRENKMGFVHLSSNLYGMYFLNAKIDSELSMHVTNMKRMINAYHTLVSLLMSKNRILSIMHGTS